MELLFVNKIDLVLEANRFFNFSIKEGTKAIELLKSKYFITIYCGSQDYTSVQINTTITGRSHFLNIRISFKNSRTYIMII